MTPGSRRRAALTAAIVGLVLVLALATAPATAQCAMCRAALESPESAGLARALRGAILFLLPVPFVATAVIAGLVVRATRRPTDPPG